jgi:response regulator RpfG family c-di-GMP phosphodiesterase
VPYGTDDDASCGHVAGMTIVHRLRALASMAGGDRCDALDDELRRHPRLGRHLLEASDPHAVATALLEIVALLGVESRAHSWRLAKRMALLAAHAGVSRHEEEQWVFGAMLHDVGKLAVPAAILDSAVALDPLGLDRVRMHASLGHAAVFGIEGLGGAAELVLAHHEYWDGSGYPQGLAGEGIPLAARAFAVVDSYDAMVRVDRSFRVGVEHRLALDELHELAGHKYDPDIVTLVDALTPAWLDIGSRHPDT